jgi:hypothetical protein
MVQIPLPAGTMEPEAARQSRVGDVCRHSQPDLAVQRAPLWLLNTERLFSLAV